MSKTNELLDLYTDVLATFGVAEGENNTLALRLGETEIPLEINGLPLVLPTERILDASPWKSCMAFHPLCENTYRGESPVIDKLRNVSLVRLNGLLGVMLKEIAEIASNPDQHVKLTPTQKLVLTMMPDADEKFYNVVKQLGALLNSTSDHRFVSMYLRRNHTVEKQVYYRAAVVTFPLLLDLIESPTQVWGVKLRVKDAKMLKAFLTYALPRADEQDMYTVGSNSEIAPTFDALVKAHVSIVKELNKVISTFPEQFEDFAGALASTRVYDRLGDYSRYKGVIPVLPGNDGESLKDSPKAPVEEKAPARNDKSPKRSFMLNVADPVTASQKPSVQSHRSGDDGSDWQRVVDDRARRPRSRDSRDDRDYDDRPRRSRRDYDDYDDYPSRGRSGRHDSGRSRDDRDYDDRSRSRRNVRI